MKQTVARVRSPQGVEYDVAEADAGFVWLLSEYRQDLGVTDDKVRVPVSHVEGWTRLDKCGKSIPNVRQQCNEESSDAITRSHEPDPLEHV